MPRQSALPGRRLHPTPLQSPPTCERPRARALWVSGPLVLGAHSGIITEALAAVCAVQAVPSESQFTLASERVGGEIDQTEGVRVAFAVAPAVVTRVRALVRARGSSLRREWGGEG